VQIPTPQIKNNEWRRGKLVKAVPKDTPETIDNEEARCAKRLQKLSERWECTYP